MSARQEFQAYLVKDPSELLLIPGYLSHVDPITDHLAEVLGHHHFSRFAKCSLKQCGQNYYEGYIVRWKSGGVSNIGHCCAERYVGKEIWGAKIAEYQREVALPHLRAELLTRRALAPQLRDRLSSLHAISVELMRKKRRFRDQCQNLYELFLNESRGDTFVVNDEMEIKEAIVDANDKPTGMYRYRYESVRIAEIHGLRSLRESAAHLVEPERQNAILTQVETVSLALTSFKKLSQLKTEFDRVEQQANDLSRWISAARLFFSPSTEKAILSMSGGTRVVAESRNFSFAALDRAEPQPRNAPRTPNRKERRAKGWR